MTALPPLLPRDAVQDRLLRVFPRPAFDTALSSPIAAAGVTAMLYAGAIVPEDEDPADSHRWMSPAMCLWMSDAAFAHGASGEREQWYSAVRAHKGMARVAALLAEWGHEHKAWYANNSREPFRDESLTQLRQRGAVVWLPGKPNNYSGPRWALSSSFAALFDPSVTDEALDTAIDSWRDGHLNPLELVKIKVRTDLQESSTAVKVTLPHDNTVRTLEPGIASQILKGVIEQWATSRLISPVVVSISEPGNKLYVADAQLLATVGISINVSSLLPDALIIDVGATPVQFWIVEAVATDGEINDGRRNDLLQWATDQKIPADRCQFLSAFTSRSAPIAKRRLKDIAAQSFAWFLDEPTHELAWYEIKRSTG